MAINHPSSPFRAMPSHTHTHTHTSEQCVEQYPVIDESRKGTCVSFWEVSQISRKQQTLQWYRVNIVHTLLSRPAYSLTHILIDTPTQSTNTATLLWAIFYIYIMFYSFMALRMALFGHFTALLQAWFQQVVGEFPWKYLHEHPWSPEDESYFLELKLDLCRFSINPENYLHICRMD